MIRGFDEGLTRFSIGQCARLKCPSSFAYGNQTVRDLIPANSTLLFDIELLAIDRRSQQSRDTKKSVSNNTSGDDDKSDRNVKPIVEEN